MTAGANVVSAAATLRAATIPDTIDGIEYRDVWKKDDETVRRDAMALGGRMGEGSASFTPEKWAAGVCVAAYDGAELIAIAAGEVRFAPRVRANMAFLRAFVVREYRHRGVVVPLTAKFHETMRRYSLEHPAERIGGTMAIVVVEGQLKRPVTNTGMVLSGYSPRGEPLILRWFDHFKL
jgi:hypothetical protein